MSIIQKIYELPDEPIISQENEEILEKIISITRTSQFAEMNLSEEKLDELVQCLVEQENFSANIPNICNGLSNASSILIVEEDEEDYI